MEPLTFGDLLRTLDQLQADLLAAAGDDGMLSRQDIRRRLATLENPQRHLADLFYRMLLQIDPQPRQRVTRDLIARGVALTQKEILPSLELPAGPLSPSEVQRMLPINPYAVSLAVALKDSAARRAPLSGQEISLQIGQYTQGLFFDYMASESSEPIEAFYAPGPVSTLTPESFSAAMGLDPENPAEVVERFVSAEAFFPEFVEQHSAFGKESHAAAIASLMQKHLAQRSIIVLGQDNHPALESQHPAYVLGVARDGSLAGFRSKVIWT